MGTSILLCGCSVSEIIIGKRMLVAVTACPEHADDSEVQQAFQALVSRLQALQKRESEDV
jgi:hypothetical protein